MYFTGPNFKVELLNWDLRSEWMEWERSECQMTCVSPWVWAVWGMVCRSWRWSLGIFRLGFRVSTFFQPTSYIQIRPTETQVFPGLRLAMCYLRTYGLWWFNFCGNCKEWVYQQYSILSKELSVLWWVLWRCVITCYNIRWQGLYMSHHCLLVVMLSENNN